MATITTPAPAMDCPCCSAFEEHLRGRRKIVFSWTHPLLLVFCEPCEKHYFRADVESATWRPADAEIVAEMTERHGNITHTLYSRRSTEDHNLHSVGPCSEDDFPVPGNVVHFVDPAA